MRIGLVCGEYPPMQGGVGAYSQIVAATLAQQGHDVSVLSHPEAVPTEGVRISGKVQHWGFSSLATVRNWAQAERLDILNLQYQTAAFGMSPWIHFISDFLRSNVPVVTTFHDLRYPYLFPKAGPLRSAIVRHLARASAGAIVTNAEDAQALATLPHVRLIPIGSNITAEADYAAAHVLRNSIAENTFLIGFFGFQNESKGLLHLLESLAQLRANGMAARLVIIGGRTGTSDPTNRAFAERVDALITEKQLTDAVHFTGFVDDASVANWLAACDVVALPFLDGASYRRGTLMAAIAHGCAIITTTPTADVPAFEDGTTMRLVEPDNVNALTAALRELADKPALRQQLQAGVQALQPLFRWDEITRQSVQFFETRV